MLSLRFSLSIAVVLSTSSSAQIGRNLKETDILNECKNRSYTSELLENHKRTCEDDPWFARCRLIQSLSKIESCDQLLESNSKICNVWPDAFSNYCCATSTQKECTSDNSHLIDPKPYLPTGDSRRLSVSSIFTPAELEALEIREEIGGNKAIQKNALSEFSDEKLNSFGVDQSKGDTKHLGIERRLEATEDVEYSAIYEQRNAEIMENKIMRSAFVVFPSQLQFCPLLMSTWKTLRLLASIYDIHFVISRSDERNMSYAESISKVEDSGDINERQSYQDGRLLTSNCDPGFSYLSRQLTSLGLMYMKSDITWDEVQKRVTTIIDDSFDFIDGDIAQLNSTKLRQTLRFSGFTSESFLIAPGCWEDASLARVVRNPQNKLKIHVLIPHVIEMLDYLAEKLRNCTNCLVRIWREIESLAGKIEEVEAEDLQTWFLKGITDTRKMFKNLEVDDETSWGNVIVSILGTAIEPISRNEKSGAMARKFLDALAQDVQRTLPMLGLEVHKFIRGGLHCNRKSDTVKKMMTVEDFQTPLGYSQSESNTAESGNLQVNISPVSGRRRLSDTVLPTPFLNDFFEWSEANGQKIMEQMKIYVKSGVKAGNIIYDKIKDYSISMYRQLHDNAKKLSNSEINESNISLEIEANNESSEPLQEHTKRLRSVDSFNPLRRLAIPNMNSDYQEAETEDLQVLIPTKRTYSRSQYLQNDMISSIRRRMREYERETSNDYKSPVKLPMDQETHGRILGLNGGRKINRLNSRNASGEELTEEKLESKENVQSDEKLEIDNIPGGRRNLPKALVKESQSRTKEDKSNTHEEKRSQAENNVRASGAADLNKKRPLIHEKTIQFKDEKHLNDEQDSQASSRSLTKEISNDSTTVIKKTSSANENTGRLEEETTRNKKNASQSLNSEAPTQLDKQLNIFKYQNSQPPPSMPITPSEVIPPDETNVTSSIGTDPAQSNEDDDTFTAKLRKEAASIVQAMYVASQILKKAYVADAISEKPTFAITSTKADDRMTSEIVEGPRSDMLEEKQYKTVADITEIDLGGPLPEDEKTPGAETRMLPRLSRQIGHYDFLMAKKRSKEHLQSANDTTPDELFEVLDELPEKPRAMQYKSQNQGRTGSSSTSEDTHEAKINHSDLILSGNPEIAESELSRLASNAGHPLHGVEESIDFEKPVEAVQGYQCMNNFDFMLKEFLSSWLFKANCYDIIAAFGCKGQRGDKLINLDSIIASCPLTWQRDCFDELKASDLIQHLERHEVTKLSANANEKNNTSQQGLIALRSCLENDLPHQEGIIKHEDQAKEPLSLEEIYKRQVAIARVDAHSLVWQVQSVVAIVVVIIISTY